MIKTNVTRFLDQKKLTYKVHDYTDTDAVGGTDVALALGEDPAHVFKTLVTVSSSRHYYVFMIPVAEELDLRKAARAAGEKKIEMIPSKELLPLTGYVHGGCSPIGMKKLFPTYIQQEAENMDRIFFSGGKIGCQIEAAPALLEQIVKVRYADLTAEKRE